MFFFNFNVTLEYMKLKIVYVFFVCLIISCAHEALYTIQDAELENIIGDTKKFILPEADDYENIPHSKENPLTKEKIELGKLLFFEPAFAVEAMHYESVNSFSCGSCHIPSVGFRPGRHQGIADGGLGFGINGAGRAKNPLYKDSEIDAQGARPLSVLNVAFVTNSMWNGSFGSDGVNIGTESQWGVSDPATARNHAHLGNLEAQNIEGLITHRLQYTEASVKSYGYKPLFDAAFPDVPERDRYSRFTASFALSAYIRSLLCTEAPFQKWLKGDKKAMTEQQKRGAALFFGKAACRRCHSETNLGSITFQAIGVDDLFEHGGLKTDINDKRNLGRGGFTNRSEDYYKFRVPQLYNLGDGGPYFHGASKQTLEEVVEYFNKAIPENKRVPLSSISPFFTPLNLNDEEVQDIVSFIRDGLRDPNLQRYVPSKVLSGMCFPDNDPQSKIDMGCK